MARARNNKLFGLSELDELLGGIPSNYMVLLEGLPGTGKTSFAIQAVCRNIEQGSKALYITTSESADKLRLIAKSIGFSIEGYGDKLRVIEFLVPTGKDILDTLTNEVVKAVSDGYDIIVIDSITPVLKVLESYSKIRAWLHTIIYRIISSAKNVLVMLVADRLVGDDPIISLLEYLADVVVDFNYDFKAMPPFSRYLLIRKFRAKRIPMHPIYFIITRDGLIPVNIVSNRLAEQVRRKRRHIAVESPLNKLLGPKLLPGTQIGVIIKQPATTLGMLYDYLVLKLSIEAAINNISVGLIRYGTGTKSLLDYGELLDRIPQGKFTIIDVDLMKLEEATHKVAKEWTSKPENIDFLIIVGYEKLAEFYGINEVNKLITSYSQVDRKLGIISLRTYWAHRAELGIPSAMLTMNDIVLGITLNEEEECLNIRTIKAPHIRRPTTILDTELKPTIEELKKRLQEIISSKRK